MTTLLNKKIEQLNNCNIIPSGLNIPVDMKIIDVRALEYSYSGNNYADNNVSYNNKILSIKIEHSKVEKHFWITIFEGATYRETDTRCIIATFNETINLNGFNTLENDTLYYTDCITKDDENFDGIETIKEILTAFNYRLYDKDELGLYDNNEGPTFEVKSHFLEDAIEEITNINFVIFHEKISKENFQPRNIQNIHEKLLELSKENLFTVISISDNEIRNFKTFLAQDEAEILFKEECNKLCNDDAVEQYIKDEKLEIGVKDLSISQWESYFGSEAWYDYNDNFKVSISIM